MIFDNEKNKNVSLGRKEFVRKKKALRVKIKKAPRRDGLPNVVLKEFALELGPDISDMYTMLKFARAFSRPCWRERM